ncbi:hypothetical protein ACA910_015981 [Epithemia clementina (nom. ined.)]
MVAHHKRKNECSSGSGATRNNIDNNTSIATASSAFVRRSAKTSWEDSQQQLQNLGLVKDETRKDGQEENEEDDFMVFLKTEILPLKEDMEVWVSEQRQYGNDLLSNLSEELSDAQKQSALCSEQAKERKRLQEQQEQQRSSLQQELQTTEAAIHSAQDEIVHLQHETTAELEACVDIEESRKREEGKLRRRVALYSDCTGVKWNYDADLEHTVEALVKVPSRHEFCRVSLDSKKMSRFEIVTALWDTIEGCVRHVNIQETSPFVS